MEERRAVAEILGTAEGETNPDAARGLIAQNAELLSQRNQLSGFAAVNAALAEILKPEGEETNVEAARRVIEARDVSALAFSQTLEFLAEILQPVGQEGLVEAAQRLVNRIAELESADVPIPTPQFDMRLGGVQGIDDYDPADPRPAMNPLLGWNTPEVVEWANRRRNRNNA